MAWKVLNSRYVFNNKFLKIREDSCLLPNNLTSDFFTVEIREWVLVVAFTPDNKIVLVKQYRQSTGEDLIELPAGVIDNNESPEDTIKREFLEETGMELNNLSKMATWFNMSGKSNSKFTAFFGITNNHIGNQKLDNEENIEIILKNPKEVIQMINSSEIKSAPYIASILFAKERYPHYFE